MSFRNKLLALFTAAVLLVVAGVAGTVSLRTQRAFERQEGERTEALLEQFRREFARRGAEVSRQIEGIASREATVRLALDLSRPGADPSRYVQEAQALAAAHQLELLELVADEGTLVSSAQWPARFGYQEEWVTRPVDWGSQGAFLRREPLPEGAALGLVAVRTIRLNERNFYIAGGQKLGREFLASLVLPAGTRALLYGEPGGAFSPQALTDASGPVAQAEKLAPLISKAQQNAAELTETVVWNSDTASTESVHALPLRGREGELLGVLLFGSSQRELVQLRRHIRNVALVVGAGGVLMGLLLSGWLATRVTRPIEQLASAANQVAAGDWSTRVEVGSEDEVGKLAAAFNEMTRQLIEQRERRVQAERVAAWRELARRLAHELKNPLFPLQITVENLLRAREQNPAQFDEVFHESAATLLAEISNLKNIVARFSDFAKMPRPELRTVRMNDIIRDVAQLHQPQLSAAAPPVSLSLQLDERIPEIQADPDLLHRALSNLVLNARDAMSAGGTLTIRTQARDGGVRLEVSDTGPGLTREERERLFTPYYTTKQHGTGLGLAIVQSVISDHGGTIAVSSEPSRGTTFCVELPERPPAIDAAREAHA